MRWSLCAALPSLPRSLPLWFYLCCLITFYPPREASSVRFTSPPQTVGVLLCLCQWELKNIQVPECDDLVQTCLYFHSHSTDGSTTWRSFIILGVGNEADCLQSMVSKSSPPSSLNGMIPELLHDFSLMLHMHALNVNFREVKVIIVDNLFEAKWRMKYDIFPFLFFFTSLWVYDLIWPWSVPRICKLCFFQPEIVFFWQCTQQ